MKSIFADGPWEDYRYWQQQDKRMVERINKLILDTQREPFRGIGKPEPLKHALSGFLSHRITDIHHKSGWGRSERLFERAALTRLTSEGILGDSQSHQFQHQCLRNYFETFNIKAGPTKMWPQTCLDNNLHQWRHDWPSPIHSTHPLS